MTVATATQGHWAVGRLIRAAGFDGGVEDAVAAAPHMGAVRDGDDFVAVLRNLGLDAETHECHLSDIRPKDAPCLFIGRDGDARVILDARPGAVLAASPWSEEQEWVRTTGERGTILRVMGDEVDPQDGSLRAIVGSYRGALVSLSAASFLTSLLSFGTPAIVMIVYDRLIPTRDAELLVSLALAAAVLIAVDLAVRVIRGRALSWIGSRIERQMGLVLFRKIAALPLDAVRAVSVDHQLQRIRQFEGLRDLFTGPVATAILDLPLALMFMAVIFVMSVPIGIFMVAVALLHAVVGLACVGLQIRNNRRAAAEQLAAQALLQEIAVRQGSIQRLGAREIWERRLAVAAGRGAAATRRSRQTALILQAVGQSFVMLAGTGAVLLGTLGAIDGGLSFGALVAMLTLIWKVLAPIQTLVSSAPQIATYRRTAEQFDRVLALPGEQLRGIGRRRHAAVRGAVHLEGVGYRAPGRNDWTVAGLNLDIKQGEFVVISGRNASGRSTVLHLIDGLLPAHAGSIRFDGMDARQIPVDDLRGAISYVTQRPDFFHGTIAQNFRLVDPTASNERLLEVIDHVGIRAAVEALPEGLDTRLSEEVRRVMSRSTLQALAVARGLLRVTPIYLLDEPHDGLDTPTEEALIRHLMELRGTHTIVLVSDRPSHFPLADKLVFMDRGRILFSGRGPQAVEKMRALVAPRKES